jgi:ABC-2 type transport system permease protein
MSVRTVAWKDLTSARRSRMLWAAVTLLSLLVALVAYTFRGYRQPPTQEVFNVFRTLMLAAGVVAPIVALVLSYLAITGERQTGGIRFLLSVPNTRRDVYLGKLASRLLLVGGGFTFVFATAALVARTTHGTLPVFALLGLYLVSLAYLAVFVGIALALSAAMATRSRAIAASMATYFLTVIFFVVPGLRLSAIVSFVHQKLLGAEANPNLYDAITYVSPYTAFQKAANLAFPPRFEQTVFYRGPDMPDLAWYLEDEVSLLVLGVWLVVPLLIGYRRFERTDLD